MEEIMKEKYLKKALVVVLLIFFALFSILVLSPRAASLESYIDTIASIDTKVETVLKLTATSTIASAGISAIPGDTATPIAAKLADFTEYFLLILCVLYSEKYLLTIIGAGAFTYLIPLACGIFGLSLFGNHPELRRLSLKTALFALAIFLVIPASIRVSDMIFETYQTSIDYTITEAEEFVEDTSELSEAKDDSLIAAILNKLSETTAGLSDRAAKIMNNFVESLAVMIVTSCVIPVLVLVFFLWIIRLLTGIDLSLPAPRHRHPAAVEE